MIQLEKFVKVANNVNNFTLNLKLQWILSSLTTTLEEPTTENIEKVLESLRLYQSHWIKEKKEERKGPAIKDFVNVGRDVLITFENDDEAQTFFRYMGK